MARNFSNPAMHLLRRLSCTTALIAMPWFTCHAAAPIGWQDLWPAGAIPGPKAPQTLRENESKPGRLTDTAIPQFRVFAPQTPAYNHPAVLIFPGGGYGILAYRHEGIDYAEWLSQRGVLAVVVKYRVSGDDAARFHYPAPLLDARRAIRTVRANATAWNVNPQQIGVMGSSAGGHLASMCATLWKEPIPSEPDDPLSEVSCRPDFAILIYPVISMADSWTHEGSKRRLLGPAPAPELAGNLSTHRRVTPETPPCFIVHAADDPGVSVKNSLEFAAACSEQKVPVVLHVFSRGGHGFGMQNRGDSSAWPSLLETWLKNR